MGTVFRFYPTVLGEGDVDGARIGGQSTVELNYLGTYETNREAAAAALDYPTKASAIGLKFSQKNLQFSLIKGIYPTTQKVLLWLCCSTACCCMSHSLTHIKLEFLFFY